MPPDRGAENKKHSRPQPGQGGKLLSPQISTTLADYPPSRVAPDTLPQRSVVRGVPAAAGTEEGAEGEDLDHTSRGAPVKERLSRIRCQEQGGIGRCRGGDVEGNCAGNSGLRERKI